MGMFGQGVGGVLNGIGKLIAYGPFAGIAQERDDRDRQELQLKQQQASAEQAYRDQQIAVAREKLAQPDAFGQTLQAAGIDPASPAGQAYYRQKVQNDVDPIHAYPTQDAAGNEGLIFKRAGEMGTAETPAIQIKGAADYNALPAGSPYIDPTGQHRVKGGAVPSPGPGGFPLYPAGH